MMMAAAGPGRGGRSAQGVRDRTGPAPAVGAVALVPPSTQSGLRANAFLGFLRADPSEYSSGSRVHRGRLTKAGNAHLWAQLVESA